MFISLTKSIGSHSTALFTRINPSKTQSFIRNFFRRSPPPALIPAFHKTVTPAFAATPAKVAHRHFSLEPSVAYITTYPSYKLLFDYLSKHPLTSKNKPEVIHQIALFFADLDPSKEGVELGVLAALYLWNKDLNSPPSMIKKLETDFTKALQDYPRGRLESVPYIF